MYTTKGMYEIIIPVITTSLSIACFMPNGYQFSNKNNCGFLSIVWIVLNKRMLLKNKVGIINIPHA